MAIEIAALDMWTLFVEYVFGSFWMATAGIMLLMFIIMGVLGRMSIYSVTWYCAFFLMAMTLGYGFVSLSIIIELALLVGLMFSWRNYLEK